MEKFLKEKMKNEGESFSQKEFAKEVAESITTEYDFDRKQKIIDGVIDAIENKADNIEANAAKAGIIQAELKLDLVILKLLRTNF